LVIALSLFAVTISVKRDRKVDHKTSSVFKQYPALLTIPPTDLQKVCQDGVVGKFPSWFDSWIIRSLVDSPFASPREIAGTIKANVDNHANIISAYIKSFLDKAQELPMFANLNFDIKVSDLVSRTKAVLKVPDQNNYDSLPQIEGLAPKFGPFVAELPQEAANTDLDFPQINKIGAVFRAEDLGKNEATTEADKDLLAKIANQKKDIIPLLHKIIHVFGQKEGPAEYNALTGPQKEFLQVFFDNFKYLLGTNDDHRDLVISTLTAQPIDKSQTLPHPFMNKAMLDHLQGIDSKYKSFFNRDSFIIAFDPEYRLEELARASSPAFFSWDFFKAYSDIAFNPPKGVKETGPAAKTARKVNRMHVMLYKVYTFARDDGTLQPKDTLTNIPILQKLFDWVLNTKMFNDPTIETVENPITKAEEEIVVNPGMQLQSLFPRDKFKRYYLPLLSLICSKIPDCKLLDEKNKKPIIDQFVNFGNHDELKSKPTVASLVDPKVLDAIIQEAAVQELKDFADDLENLGQLGDPDNKLPQLEIHQVPTDFKPDEDSEDEDFPRKDGGKPSNIIIRKKLKTPKTFNSLPEELTPGPTVKKGSLKLPQEDEKLQKNFDDKIGAKFLPKTGGEDDKRSDTQLDKFIDTIESTDNDAKKNTLRKLLITFIVKSYKDAQPASGPNPVAPLLNKAVQHLTNRLKGSIEEPRTRAFRNFLFRTLNEKARYNPTTAEDEYTYLYDLIFFIKFPLANIALSLRKKGNTMTKDESAIFTRVSTELKALMDMTAGNELRKGYIHKNQAFGPEFLERASGIEFFINFLDFFAYWEDFSEKAKASNADYYRVYLQFYQVLAHIRRSAVQMNEDPHQYVLHKMEECMDIAEAQQTWVDTAGLRGHCLFSHRKYAEIYFFYKMYLYSVKKVGQPLQQFKKGDKFNTHTRIFLTFASENSEYARQLELNCPKLADEPICTSWLLFNEMLSFMRAPMMSDEEFGSKLSHILKVDTIDARLNLFNGLEAAYYFNRRANMVDWARVYNIFDDENPNAKTGLAHALQFRKGDEKSLARYLIRSFKKLDISKNEQAIAKFVVSVLEGSESASNKDDTLKAYLLFDDRIIPFYLKVFLQFAVKDAHFERIARLLINYGLSYNLVAINDVEKDFFFQDLYLQVSQMKENEVPDQVMKILQEEYAKHYKKCKAMSVSKVEEIVSGSDLMDMLDGLEDFSAEEKTVLAEEHDNAVKVIEIVKEVSTTVILPEGVDAQKVADLAKSNLRSAFSSQLDIELKENVVMEEVEEDEDVEDEEDEEDGYIEVGDVDIPIADEKFMLGLTKELANLTGQKLQDKITALINENKELDNVAVNSVDSAKIGTPEALRDVKRKLLDQVIRNKLKNALRARRRSGPNPHKGTRSGNRKQKIIDRAQKRAQKQFTNDAKQNKQKHLI